MATIRKRAWKNKDGDQTVKWIVDYKDQSGKRRFRNFDRKRDAEAWMLEAGWQVRQGVHTARRESPTVAKAADEWIERGEAEKLQRSTLKSYREIVRLHLVPLLGDTRLADLTRPNVIEFRRQLLESRSKAMAAKALSALSSILKQAQDAGKVAQNVAADVRVARVNSDREKLEIPTQAELRSLLAKAEGKWRSFFMLAISSGMRSSELRGLPWRDVDLDAARVNITQRADQWSVIGPPKSDAGTRSIPIPPEVVLALREWKEEQREGLVWPTSTGTPYRHNNLLRRVFIPLQVAAGVSQPKLDGKGKPIKDEDGAVVMVGRYGLHALRHAAASNWIASGVDLKRLQSWLGHANVQITLDTYGHLMADADRDAELAMASSRAVFATKLEQSGQKPLENLEV